jgi:hypothetical protein
METMTKFFSGLFTLREHGWPVLEEERVMTGEHPV